ncbi:hypothetical protein ACVWVY_000957 [Bradyrhizobium sp. URHC0002]
MTSGLTGPGSRLAWPGRRRSAAPQHDAFDSAAHRSAAREWTTADGASGKAGGRPTIALALRLGRRHRILARTRGRGRRDRNDGMGFVVGVASVVNLVQETRELVAIEPRPAAIQAGEEFELAACEYRHRKRRDAEAGDIQPMARAPLHLPHSGVVPAAAGADINAHDGETAPDGTLASDFMADLLFTALSPRLPNQPDD